MEKFVSLDKRSKKAQKAYYAERRITWGELNPVTRSVPSGKSYNRNKDKQALRRTGKEFRDGFGTGSFLFENGNRIVLNLKFFKNDLIFLLFSAKLTYKKMVAILSGLVERPGSTKKRVRHPLFFTHVRRYHAGT